MLAMIRLVWPIRIKGEGAPVQVAKFLFVLVSGLTLVVWKEETANLLIDLLNKFLVPDRTQSSAKTLAAPRFHSFGCNP